MDSEIKRLLKLDSIPGFELLDSEKEKLKEWKKAQKSIKPKKASEPTVKKDEVLMEGMGTGETPTIVPKESIGETIEEIEDKEKKTKKRGRKKTINIVKEEEKETGKIEES